VLPTLLRGKLVEFYVEASDETRGSLEQLKTFLLGKSRVSAGPLSVKPVVYGTVSEPW